jgi:GR25 family glycosyltransferase involved in LPS biosynthesis
MFGHIIEYCLKKNIRLDIYTEFSDDLGWLSFYILHYIPGNDNTYDLEKQDDKLIRFYSLNKYTLDNDYDKIILTTDDDMGLPDEAITDKFICIDHHYTNRRPKVPIHIGIRYFVNNPTLDWVIPVYKLIDIESKNKISKPIITCIGRFNCPKDITNFKNLFSNFSECTFALVDRNLEEYKEIYKEFKNMNCFPSLNTAQMYNLLIQSDYVFISDENSDHNNESLSAIIPIGLSCLCTIIMPEKMNEHFNFKSVITYQNSVELCKPNFELINSELESLIIHKFKIFDKYFITEDIQSEVSDNNYNFDLHMIVYSKSSKRNNNYKSINKIAYKFEAIDALNNYDKYKNFCIENNIFTQEYLKYCDNINGKLGCSLSHINLWKNFLNSKKNWLLVLEDDVKLKNYNPIIIELLIGEADKNNSNYIQLFTNGKYFNEQIKQEKINYNLYKMIPQWGGVAYLINKKGIEIMRSKIPFDENNDIMISKNIEDLNALCFINDIFINKGAIDGNDKISEYGSLIW